MTTMVLLVGEQPIPNLLPVLHEKPDEALLVYTDRTTTQMQRLRDLIKGRCRCDELHVSAFDIVATRDAMGARLTERGWRGKNAIFNLTGGTKTMAFAAYELAVRLGSDFLYFQTEGTQSLIYRYTTSGGAPTLAGEPQSLGPLLTIDDYFRLHLGDYNVAGFSTEVGGVFEKAVCVALRPAVDEIIAGIHSGGAIDIDLVIRCGNQIAIAEVKDANPSKHPIGQLAIAAERQHLGTYTGRFLVTSRSWEKVTDLKELADARGITLIEVTSYDQDRGVIAAEDIENLRRIVQSKLRCLQP